MSAREQDEELLRDDPGLPAELRAAFAAYSQVTPARDGRDALFQRIERADPRALLVDERAARWRKPWWLSMLTLSSLAVVGALTWWQGAPVAPDLMHAGPAVDVAPVQAPASRPALELGQPAFDTRPIAAVEPAREVTPRPSHSAAAEGRSRPAVARVRAQASARRSAQAADDTAQELALLMRAKRVMASDAEAALALASEHARRFPRGSFAEEREVIAIEALVRSAKLGEAKQRATRFRAAHPRSPHLDRLSVVLAEP